MDPTLLFVGRMVAIAGLCFYGVQNSTLTTWILLSMVIGMVIGYDFPAIGVNLQVLSKIFIQLIKTVIAPLLFGTLVMAIAGQSNAGQVGRMSIKAFAYFTAATSIALVIGLAAINFTQAGAGMSKSNSYEPKILPVTDLSVQVDSVKGTYALQYHDKIVTIQSAPAKQDWKQMLLHIFPENVAKMIFDGAVLQIVVFSLLFGFAVRQIEERHRKIILDWTESLTEVMFKFTGLIMYFAPLAVGGAMAYTIGAMGLGVVGNLLKLLATLYGALGIFILVVFIPVMLIARIPILKFFKAIYEPASLAFATASSEAALPKAMTAMEKFGVPRKVVSFVLPTGYSFNLDGSTLYLSLASIFCAQAAGIQLSWQTQLAMMGTLLLTSKGVAGVPRASFLILTATISQFGLKEWPLVVIAGVDALMDMGRTCVNLVGNCLASAVVARWEGEFDDEMANQV